MLQVRLANWPRKTKRRKNNGIFSVNEISSYLMEAPGEREAKLTHSLLMT